MSSPESRLGRIEKVLDGRIDANAANASRLDIVDAITMMDLSIPECPDGSLDPVAADARVERIWNETYGDGFGAFMVGEDRDTAAEGRPRIEDDGTVEDRIQTIQRAYRLSLFGE